MSTPPDNVSALVGRTPMVKLGRVTQDLDVELFAKLEMFNPGGSVKDRIGVAMVEAAEREGRIEPGRTTIVEATSGNTGIALAFVCAARGYDLILTLPQGMSREREALLRLYGAEVRVTESMGGMNEAVDAARALAARDDVFLPDQFSNPANPEIHRRTTGPELWDALDGRIDVFVAGVGHRRNGDRGGGGAQGAQPALPGGRRRAASSAVLSGGRPGPHKIQGIGAGFVPAVLNREMLDEVIAVETRTRSRWPARSPAARACWPGCRAGPRSGRPWRSRATRVPRRADRHGPAGLRRALRLDPVLRPRPMRPFAL